MAGNVMAGFGLFAWAMLASAAACAMGPSAPFAAPNGGSGEQLGLDAGFVNVQGLAGVRLGGQAGAVIDGIWVPKGATVRGAKLETITRSRVVLRHPDGHTESLDMFPSPSAGASQPQASAPNEAPPK